ncbi:MAG: RloB family protein [Chitinophagales bacterium]
MLSRSKLYTRREPTKEAKLFIIFCEGQNTEPMYFRYFQNISHNINLEIVEHDNGKNNPIGLFETACKLLVKSEENPNPKYEIASIDEVWFVIDTDKWNEHGNKINELKEKLVNYPTWKIAQSNPCFEVWQYYHHFTDKLTLDNLDTCSSWKNHLNDKIGGFNCNKHPIFIEEAIQRAKNIHQEINNQPDICCTEVFNLAELILPFVQEEINAAKKRLL